MKWEELLDEVVAESKQPTSADQRVYDFAPKLLLIIALQLKELLDKRPTGGGNQ